MTSRPAPPPVLPGPHLAYVASLDEAHGPDTPEAAGSEHLRMSGVYWGLSAVTLLGGGHLLPRKSLLGFIAACRRPNGGYAGNVGHDAHLLYTLSALQLLVLLDALDDLPPPHRDATLAYIVG